MKRRTARDNERKISNILIAVSEIGILLVKEKINDYLEFMNLYCSSCILRYNSIIQQFLGEKL